jgi:outer membrane lipoprotein-sorting protein
MKRLLISLLTLAALLPAGAMAQDARSVMERTADAIRRGSPLIVEMNIGTLRLKGDKFVLEAGGMTTWFDGKTQWTLNVDNREVTLMQPTDRELQSINPYAWLSLYKQGSYDMQLTTLPGSYEVLMQSRDPQNELSMIRLAVDRRSYLPQRINVTLRGGETQLITIKECRTRQKQLADADFVFDAKAHPDVEVIDLR